MLFWLPHHHPLTLPLRLPPSPFPNTHTHLGLCFLGKAGRTPALSPRILGSRTTLPGKASRVPRRTPGTRATKVPGTAIWEGTASTPGSCWRPRSCSARSRGARSSRWRSNLRPPRGSTAMIRIGKSRTPVTCPPRGRSGRTCPPRHLRLPGWAGSRTPRRGGPSIPEQGQSGRSVSCNKGHFPTKTCIREFFFF